MGNADTNRVFRRVYTEASRLIGQMCDQFIKGLDALALDRDQDTEFRRRFRRLVMQVLAPGNGTRLEVNGSSDPEAVLEAIMNGLGAQNREGWGIANTLVHNWRNGSPSSHFERVLQSDTRRMWTRARPIYEKLVEIRQQVRQPYAGRDDDPEDGIDQVVDLLKEFPDIANTVYANLGMGAHVEGFPPQAKGTPRPGSDARIFTAEANAEIDSRWFWDTATLIGLVVITTLLTVFTLGSFSMIAAAIVGAGLAVGTGAVRINSAQESLERGEAAAAAGFMSPQTLARLEGELTGAWRSTLVDFATAGVLARFGGAGSWGRVIFRGAAIEGAGGGLSTAVQPNVWSSPNRVALILYGTVMSAASGAAGAGLGEFAVRRQVQMTLRRGQQLTAGTEVRVTTGDDSPPLTAVVESVDPSTGTVRLKKDDVDVEVRVDRTEELQATRSDVDVDAAGLTPKPARARPGTRAGGTPEAINPGASKQMKRNVERQNDSADWLAEQGFDIQHADPNAMANRSLPNDKAPDFIISGNYWDHLNIESGNPGRVRSAISSKAHRDPARRQAERIVLRLDDTDLSVDQVLTALRNRPVPALIEMIIIKGGQYTMFPPR